MTEHEITQKYLNLMLDCFNSKEEQEMAKNILITELFLDSRNIEETMMEGTLPNLYNLMLGAAEDLYKKSIKSESLSISDYDACHKKAQKYHEALGKLIKQSNDPDIGQVLMHLAYSDDEVSPKTYMNNYNKTFLGIDRIYRDFSFFLHSSKKKGRPSLEPLYNYVTSLAKLYSGISNEKFKIYRDENSKNNNYEPITQSHMFVFQAIQCLNELTPYTQKYSNANICNACERAQKALK